MFTVQLKIPKRLRLEIPAGRAQVMAQLAQLAGDMLHTRVEQGEGWDGQPIPELKQQTTTAGKHSNKRKWFFTHSSDPRQLQERLPDRFRPWNMRGEPGRPQWFVFRGQYKEMKKLLSGHTSRGSSLTGKMWQSLKASVRQKGQDYQIRLYFSGSAPSSYVRPGKAGGSARVRNRDKARLLQYEGRSGVGTHEDGAGRQFVMMRFSEGELDTLVTLFAREIRLVFSLS